MKNYQIIILIVTLSLVSVLLETTIINFPFIFLIGSILSALIKKTPVFIGVFLLSFIIDSMRVSNFGLTVLFIFGTLLVILLYEKFSGSDDILVASFIIAVALFIYAQFLTYSISLIVLFFGLSFITLYVFSVLKKKGILT